MVAALLGLGAGLPQHGVRCRGGPRGSCASCAALCGHQITQQALRLRLNHAQDAAKASDHKQTRLAWLSPDGSRKHRLTCVCHAVWVGEPRHCAFGPEHQVPPSSEGRRLAGAHRGPQAASQHWFIHCGIMQVGAFGVAGDQIGACGTSVTPPVARRPGNESRRCCCAIWCTVMRPRIRPQSLARRWGHCPARLSGMARDGMLAQQQRLRP